MKLKIENFAKIEEADIQLDGITVIAGLNDTGKSTIGKVLYSMFNSLNSIDKNVANKREKDIHDICEEIMEGILEWDRYFVSNDGDIVTLGEILAEKIIDCNGEFTKAKYREFLHDVIDTIEDKNQEVSEEEIEDCVESSYARISAIKNASNRDLYKEVLERYFSIIFSQQMNNCDLQESEALLTLTLKTKEIRVLFRNNKCVEMDNPVKIMHDAFFIDDPFVLDSINLRGYGRNTYAIRDNLIRKIRHSEKNILDGIFDAVTSKESLKEINDVFDKVVNGKIFNTREGMKYSSNEHKEPISISNMSAGLKGFILIRTLLEKGILKERDVLILDEPEVHMHTQWQLYYAQIIVLLQKYFDLTILVTTHSSHFLQAIEYYSKYFKLKEKCNYYLARKNHSGVTFENVTDDISKIYSEMVEPSILLDKLAEELEYEDEK